MRVAIARAARNIRSVSKRQVPKGWRHQVSPGITVEQRVTPLTRVGCYVPAGRYPLPSSLLMTAIPARVAGVTEIIVCCPRPDAAVFAAAIEAGADRLFRIGGAHAIAAMAYGTRTMPRVDKIVGPGNRWVSAAKSLVSADCGIDFYAGPTEILIVAASGSPAWIAADLLAQAEHDPDARAVMITSNRRLAGRVAAEIDRQMPASGPARQSIARHGGIIVCPTMNEAIALANDAAAEHVVAGNDSDREARRECRRRLCRRMDRASGRRLRDRLQSRAPHRRRRPVPRRPECRGFCETRLRSASDETRPELDRENDYDTGKIRGTRSTRAFD